MSEQSVSEATEVKGLNLDEYALTTNDPFIPVIWPLVKADLSEMEKVAEELRKNSPPSAVEVYDHVKKNPNDTEALKLIAEKVAQYEQTLNELRARAHAIAKEELQPEGLPEETLKEMRSKFDGLRDKVKGQLQSVETYTDTMNLDEVGEAFQALKVPQFRTGVSGASTSAPSQATKIREWAKENGVEVNERGRISADVVAKYEAAQAGK